jgi:hypothetical protein
VYLRMHNRRETLLPINSVGFLVHLGPPFQTQKRERDPLHYCTVANIWDRDSHVRYGATLQRILVEHVWLRGRPRHHYATVR